MQGKFDFFVWSLVCHGDFRLLHQAVISGAKALLMAGSSTFSFIS